MSQFLLKLHRVLGVTLSLFFFVWFSSAFVMLFRTFPSAGIREQVQVLAPIPRFDSITIEQLREQLSRLPDSLTLLRVQADAQGKCFELSWQKTDGAIRHSSGNLATSKRSSSDLRHYAQRFNRSPITKVEYIPDVETWVPYHRGQALPAYKYYYDDDEGTELYLSSHTGEVVQHTTRSSRMWAYLGAIPHWIYPYQLRQYRGVWVGVISVLASLGFVMCVSGLMVGLYIAWRNRKSRGKISPYKTLSYRWHHYLGLMFGGFATCFIFSGLMSVQEVPQTLRPTTEGLKEQLDKATFAVDKEQLALELQSILSQGEESKVRLIECLPFDRHHYFVVHSLDQRTYLHFPKGHSTAIPLALKREDVKKYLQRLSGDKTIHLETLETYDNYYIDRKGELPLPVYKVEVADEDQSSLYIDPKTAHTTYYNGNTRLRRLLYNGLHSWVFAPIVAYPLLWWSLIIVILVGGWWLSTNGLFVSLRYLEGKNKSK